MGSGANSYMRKGFLIYEEMRKYLAICKYRPLVIYDFATDPVRISLFMRKIFFSLFISVLAIISKISTYHAARGKTVRSDILE
jgi:hypothetical protein